jgi:hypothetical protein
MESVFNQYKELQRKKADNIFSLILEKEKKRIFYPIILLILNMAFLINFSKINNIRNI